MGRKAASPEPSSSAQADVSQDLRLFAHHTLMPALAELKKDLVEEIRTLLQLPETLPAEDLFKEFSIKSLPAEDAPETQESATRTTHWGGAQLSPLDLGEAHTAHEWSKRHFKCNGKKMKAKSCLRSPKVEISPSEPSASGSGGSVTIMDRPSVYPVRTDRTERSSVASLASMDRQASAPTRETSRDMPPNSHEASARDLFVDGGRESHQETDRETDQQHPSQRTSLYEMLKEETTSTPLLSAQPSDRQPSLMTRIVESQLFDHFFGGLVLLSAAFLGMETEFEATHSINTGLPPFFEVCNCLFCVAFTLELAMRICVERGKFFTDPEAKGWNLFDLVVVGLQLLEELWCIYAKLRASGTADGNVIGIVRLLRTVGRLIRTIRIFRVVRLLHELRMLCTSIVSSMKSLGWTLMLLMMIIYIVSVFFTEVVALYARNVGVETEAQVWFGHLWRSCLTLFEAIMGGLSWDEAVTPLIEEISPLLGALFCLYVSFCAMAVLNVVTGVFVDKATRTAQDEKDETLANSISTLFVGDTSPDELITWKEFSSKLTHAEMQEYFRDLNVDVSEAKGLFQLLDVDGSGSVDTEEIVSGCLRLRGPAKALELALLSQETNALQSKVESMERSITALAKSLQRGHRGTMYARDTMVFPSKASAESGKSSD